MNGWRNRETWLVGLWFDTSTLVESEGKKQDEVAEELEETVRTILETDWPETSGIVADLCPDLDEVIRKIDFQELAEHVLE